MATANVGISVTARTEGFAAGMAQVRQEAARTAESVGQTNQTWAQRAARAMGGGGAAGSLMTVLRGGAIVAGARLLASELSRSGDEALRLANAFREGEIGAASLQEGLIRGLPIVGSILRDLENGVKGFIGAITGDVSAESVNAKFAKWAGEAERMTGLKDQIALLQTTRDIERDLLRIEQERAAAQIKASERGASAEEREAIETLAAYKAARTEADAEAKQRDAEAKEVQDSAKRLADQQAILERWHKEEMAAAARMEWNLAKAQDAEATALKRRGEAIRREIITPAEEYAERLKEISDLNQRGAISGPEFARAQKAADKRLREAAEAGLPEFQPMAKAGAVEAGGLASYSARRESVRQGFDAQRLAQRQLQIEERVLQMQIEATDWLAKIAGALTEPA